MTMTSAEMPADGTSTGPAARQRPADLHESRVRSYCRSFETTFVSASGSTMTDETGRTYIDFLAGCSALNYGHNDADLVATAVAHLSSSGLTLGLDLHTKAKEEFIEAFAGRILAPRRLDHRLQFTGPTGTNAVEAALKLARKVTGRTAVIAFTNGFHGVTTGSLAATGNRHHRSGLAGQGLGGVQRWLYDGYAGPTVDTAALLDRLLDDPSSGFDPPAAILVETVQGEGGLKVASIPWLRRIEEVARRHGALLIVDDIQAGCGRTGPFFSFELAGLVPDIVTLSKSLSGIGLPLALALIRPELDQWSPGEHNGTFRGNNLAFATATAAIEKFWADDGLERDVARRGELVRRRLTRMANAVPGAVVTGRGMMLGLDVVDGDLATAICRRAFADGLIVETSGANDQVVKVLAPLTTPDELLVDGLDRLATAVTSVAGAST